MNLLVLIALALVASGYSYLGWRMISPLDVALSWKLFLSIVLSVPFMLVLWLPLFYWRSDRSLKARGIQFLKNTSHFCIACLSLMIFICALRDLLSLPLRFFGHLPQQLYGNEASLFVLLICLALFVLGTFNARSQPRVKRVKIPMESLPEDLEGFKIAQISDLHIGAGVDRSFVEKIVTSVNSLDPDLIALTGDIGDSAPERHSAETAELTKLSAPLGKFYVTGNHEYYWNYRG